MILNENNKIYIILIITINIICVFYRYVFNVLSNILFSCLVVEIHCLKKGQ